MKIVKCVDVDIVQIDENQIITILKTEKPYVSFRPLKTVKYKNWLTIQNVIDMYQHIKDQGYIDGDNQNEKD